MQHIEAAVFLSIEIKNKITNTVKDEYLVGNDHDLEQLEAMLLKLTDTDGKALYEKKNFEQWVKQAKKREKPNAGSADEWARLRCGKDSTKGRHPGGAPPFCCVMKFRSCQVRI